MGKEKFIEFTKELAKLYIKVEECYETVNDFQKEIGFKKFLYFTITIQILILIRIDLILDSKNKKV